MSHLDNFSTEELFRIGTTNEEASKIVSKWLDDSESDSSGELEQIPASSSNISRVQGVGLGAEDLNELLAKKRLDPIERKMKYKLEAAKAWKEKRENEAKEALRKLEDDHLDRESKSNQFKKRNRPMSKSQLFEQLSQPKKKAKSNSKPSDSSNGANFKQSSNVNSSSKKRAPVENIEVEETIFDFSSNVTELASTPTSPLPAPIAEPKQSHFSKSSHSQHRSHKYNHVSKQKQ